MEGIPKFLMVQDVMEILSISKAKAYSIIRNLNDELTAQGYETLARAGSDEVFCREVLLRRRTADTPGETRFKIGKEKEKWQDTLHSRPPSGGQVNRRGFCTAWRSVC